jgi:hypothetical protein
MHCGGHNKEARDGGLTLNKMQVYICTQVDASLPKKKDADILMMSVLVSTALYDIDRN